MEAARNAEKAGDDKSARRLYEVAKTKMPTPEIVAGTPEQMAQASARNMQLEAGLNKPVMPPSEQYAPLDERFKASFASTQESKRNYYDMLYGKGNWIPLTEGRNLVPAGSPDSPNVKDRYVIDNPAGLDLGDIVELSGRVPEVVTSIAAGIARTPTPAGSLAKVAELSGITAAAGQTAGAIQDVLFRFATGQPIDPEEIAARRTAEGLGETAIGVAFPLVAGKAASRVKEAMGIRRFNKSIEREGEEAVKTLSEFGVNPATSAEVGQAIRETTTNPGSRQARAVGDYIAKVVTDADRQTRQQVQRQLGFASQNIDRQAMSVMDAAAPRIDLPPDKIVEASIEGARMTSETAQQNANKIFDAAVAEIESQSQKKGVGKFFVSLNETKKAISELKKISTLRGKDPETGQFINIENMPSVSGIISDLENATSMTQQFQNVRYIRSRLGEVVGGNQNLYGDLDAGVARKLYRALSADLEKSTESLSGKARELMLQYNKDYANFIADMETNQFARKLSNNLFDNPSDLVDTLMQGKKTDWEVTQKLLPKPVFDQLRRVTIDTMRGDATTKVMGQDVINVAALVRKVDSMKDATIRDQLFGGTKGVQVLRRLAEQQDALQRVGGVFTRPTLPSMDDLDQAIGIAQEAGIDSANAFFDKAVALAKSRRNGLAESMLSLSRNGNYQFSARNPEEVLDAVVFNSEMRPDYIKKFINGMPAQQRTDLGDMAFQRIFENSRNATASSVKGTREQFDVDKIVTNVFGSKDRMDAMRDLIGDRRMGALEAWVAYDTKLALEKAKKTSRLQQMSGLLATAPYPNLFAARATSMALESIAGMKFIQKANPADIVAFPRARAAMLSPNKAARDIAIIQQAINEGGKELFNNYNEMLDGLTVDQQRAVDQYLFGGRD